MDPTTCFQMWESTPEGFELIHNANNPEPKVTPNANKAAKPLQGILQTPNRPSTGKKKKTVVVVSPRSEANSMDVETGSNRGGDSGGVSEATATDVKVKVMETKKAEAHQCDGYWEQSWTETEDQFIYFMRQRGHSWEDVNSVLHRGKRQVRLRYKWLENAIQDIQAEDSDSDSPQYTAKSNDNGKKHAAATSSSSSSSASTSARPASSTCTCGMVPADGINRALLKNMADMYPDQKILRPDNHFSVATCEVLAAVEARYRANKWLCIQADYAAITGLMVDAKILEAKFKEGDDEDNEDEDE
ncbi:hypothetical protein Hte_007110 [Hypoxylon texense]